MAYLKAIFVGLVAASFIFICQASAKIDEENVMGVWLFDEGSGDTASDSSPNGFDGEIVGPKWEDEGIFGSCLEFDGVDDYVDCGENDKSFF